MSTEQRAEGFTPAPGDKVTSTCLITTAQPVDYSRFYQREAATLAASGLAVTLLGLPAGAPFKSIPGVELVPLTLPAGLRKAGALAALTERAEQVEADVYHCFDPWALRAGLATKRRRRAVKVIYDSTEFFPAVYHDRADMGWAARVAAEMTVRFIERRAIRHADALIETNATRAERFRRAGREVTLVPNYPPRPTSIRPDRPRTKRVAYTGLISRPRGFDVLLEAFARTLEHHGDAQLVVMGHFDPRSNIENRSMEFIREHALAERVELHPWLPYTEMLDLLATCDIGVILLQPDRRNDFTGQPNKLFEFMGAGLAVVASDFPEIGPVVRREDCGIAVDPTRPDVVADALDSLLADPRQAGEMCRRGREAVEREYNWDAAARQLLEVYARLGT